MDNYVSIESMLADILDESKPLPQAEPPAIITAPEAVPDEPQEEGTAPCLDEIPPTTEAEVNKVFTTPVVDTPFADTAERAGYAVAPVVLPEFTTDEIAATLDIRNFATLVTLNTARWHAKIKDRKASRDAALAAGADEAAFESRKRLLAGTDEKLKRIHKSIDTARAKYYELTLPWTTTGITDIGRRSGARLLPNTSFFDFCTEMARIKEEMRKALDEFVPEYPNLIEAAKGKLGTSFDIRDYPNEASIRAHFDLSFDFQPIPLGQDFKGLPDQQCSALATAIESKTKKMLENAMQDLWVRAHEAVGRMAERLSHPDKLFHYTLVDNVRSVANQLKHLNVTGDPRVEELRQYIDKNLCQHDVDALRKTPTLRMATAASAQAALDKMAKFAGGA